jgi:hypothetical protein
VNEQLLTSDLLRRGPDDADWNDVLRRAGGEPRRRRAAAIVAAVVTVVVGIASAYAFGYPIIDFGKAPKGPEKVVNDFGSMEVGAPEGMAPGVLPHETRRITAVRIDGKEHVLWVAPTKQGGFCEEWSDFVGGCRADRHDDFAKRLDVSGTGDVLAGSFFQKAGTKLVISYADGASDEIPFVWVTAPIDAGFYLFRVPDAHRAEGHRPTAVRLLDKRDAVLAREEVRPPGKYPSFVTHELPGYPHLSVPAEAIWDQRRQLFDLRADDGARIGLWIARKRGGGTCMWANQALGCSQGAEGGNQSEPALGLGFSGAATHVTLCCTVGPQVARVEARFEDGDSVELFPKQGYLVWPIPSRHYPLGHRLDRLIGFDSDGHEIANRPIVGDQRGLYPCAHPKNYGYGVSMCP